MFVALFLSCRVACFACCVLVCDLFLFTQEQESPGLHPPLYNVITPLRYPALALAALTRVLSVRLHDHRHRSDSPRRRLHVTGVTAASSETSDSRVSRVTHTHTLVQKTGVSPVRRHWRAQQRDVSIPEGGRVDTGRGLRDDHPLV